MLDTHAVARSLTAADFTPAQADALTDALRLVVEQGEHVTSDQFKVGMAEMRAQQRTEIAEKWSPPEPPSPRSWRAPVAAALAAERRPGLQEKRLSMRVIEVREDNPWPKWTEATQVVEGMHKPVFVRPVLAKRDDGEIAWPSVQIRIGGLGARQGAKFNGHSLAEAKEKADRLRADAQSSGHSGTVPFKVQLRKTAVNTKLTPAEARRVAQAIDEARRLLAHTEPGGEPHRPSLLAKLARLNCFERKKEDVAVEVLGHILSTSEPARAALSDLVAAGGALVGRIDWVKTQVRGPMGARPDLAGYDESGREHVLIEAKFEAKLTKKQRDGTYLNQLRNRKPAVVLFVARLSGTRCSGRRRSRGY